ncbi:hypothetical protein MTP10_01665 [Nonomuraea sp. 3-1Str]|uniref:hypothetical protein n=1 Tax=Nonomuraea sp. 3-1Str TaxID=2929801 RepID=UPI002861946F|nr:hypothetical protein [Nonomuraea sp. 3-1Str]MDR8407443.1 hypothetical protein [Nonomuraea sp. 3-1Str]
MPLQLPPNLAPVPDTGPTKPTSGEPVVSDPLLDPLATHVVEVKRVVPASGNLSIGRQQAWLGPERAGLPITMLISTDHLHVFTAAGGRVKSVPPS